VVVGAHTLAVEERDIVTQGTNGKPICKNAARRLAVDVDLKKRSLLVIMILLRMDLVQQISYKMVLDQQTFKMRTLMNWIWRRKMNFGIAPFDN